MAIKLDGLSPKELESLIKQAQAKMTAAKVASIASVRAKIDALLANEGLHLAEVYPARAGAAPKRTGAGVPKYRNPALPSQTWTGFGKKPAWFLAALKKSGVTEETLRIVAPAAQKRAAATKPSKAAKRPNAKAISKRPVAKAKA